MPDRTAQKSAITTLIPLLFAAVDSKDAADANVVEANAKLKAAQAAFAPLAAAADVRLNPSFQTILAFALAGIQLEQLQAALPPLLAEAETATADMNTFEGQLAAAVQAILTVPGAQENVTNAP